MPTSKRSIQWAILLALPTLAETQSPQRLRLADALAEADRAAFANREAVGAVAAADARAALPLKGILPSARLETGFLRTTDPIGAFGTQLRQRRATSTAFDPARLNAPDPINNVQSGVVLDVPVLNADALSGWMAARTATRASEAAAQWTNRQVRYDVVRAYYGAILAGEKVAALARAEAAAHSVVQQVEHMMEQGLVTHADALQARVRAADVTLQLTTARHDASTATRQLLLLLGRTSPEGATLPLLPNALPDDSLVQALLRQPPTSTAESPESAALQRDDVRAAQLGLDAARLDAHRASATVLPRVNGFARYDWHSPATLYAGRPNWTVGVMASWSLFGGGAELADIAGAQARMRLATVGREAAAAQAALEADETARGLSLAESRLDLAARAATQSREARRLVERRYAGGLATIAELLGADAMATEATLKHAAARYEAIVAVAAHRRATGADPAALAQLAPASIASITEPTRE
ncbi:MAG TPA: TolC family protein [Gemmatimonas sp.]|uniref:TolC family protein n=1 Tax=Gemmatimonas sp. TaxID=1962908 RepID=UPI002ED924F4